MRSFFITVLLLNTQCIYCQNEVSAPDTTNENNMPMFYIVDERPEFPGGDIAMFQYISENIKYPEQAKKDSIAGRVLVGFNIDMNGKINNVRIINGVRGDLDNAAIEVVKGMPEWEPAVHKGEPVEVQFNLPIKFVLPNR